MLQWALGTGKVNSVALVSLDEKWAERQYVLITNKTTQSSAARHLIDHLKCCAAT